MIYNTKINSKYNNYYFFNNIIIKILFFVIYNISLDLFLINFCFGEKTNIIFPSYSCKIKKHIHIFIFNIFIIIFEIFFGILINIFNSDSFYLSNNNFSKPISNYWIIMIFNNFLMIILLRYIKKITHETFFIINLIISLYMIYYYYSNIIYYNESLNIICGTFHTLYFYTNIFFFIFYYIDINEKGILYLFSSLLCFFIFWFSRKKYIEFFLYEKKFNEFINKNHLLFYLKKLNTLSNDLDIKNNSYVLKMIIKLHILKNLF